LATIVCLEIEKIKVNNYRTRTLGSHFDIFDMSPIEKCAHTKLSIWWDI
jgi:hypothetical protein